MRMVPSGHIDLLLSAELGMRRITSLLVDEFGGRYGSGVIEQFVSEFLDEMVPTATITTFLPLLAERGGRERTRARPPESHLPAESAATEAATDGEDRTEWERADEVGPRGRDARLRLATPSSGALPAGTA
jgi:hypothetical protein